MRSEDDEVGDDLSHDWEWMKKWVVARIVILAGSLAIGYLILNGIVSIEKKPAPPTPIKTPAPDRGPPGPLNDLREPVFVQNQNSLHVLVPIPEELASKKADRIQFEKEAAALIEKFSDPKIDFMEREKAWQQITAIDRREIPILIGHAARQKDEEEIKKLRDFHWKLLESSEEGLKAVGRSLAQYDELLKGVQGDRQKMLEIEKKRLAELKFGFAILEQEIYRSWGDFAAWSVRVKKERDHLIQNFPAYVAYFDIAHRYFFRNPAEKDLIVAERAKQILKAIEAKEPLPGREKFITDFLGQVLKRFEEIKNEKKSRSEMREKSGYESGVKGEDPSLISRKSRSESEKESRTISHLRLGNSWSKSLSRSKPLVKIKNNNIIVYNAYSSWKAMIQVAAVAEKIVDPSGLMPSGVRKVKKTFGFYRTGTMKFVSENSPTGLLQTKQVLSIDLRDLLGLKETVSGNAWVLNLKEEEVKGNPEFVSVLSQRLDEDAHIFIHGEARLPDDITPLKLLLKSFHSDQVHFVSNKEELVRGMQRVDPKANANRLGLTHSEAESWSELFASLKGITLKLEMDDRVRSQGYDEKKMMIASIPLLVLLKQVPGDKLAGVLNRLGLTFGPRSEIRVGFSYLAALDRLMAQKQGKEISLQSA